MTTKEEKLASLKLMSALSGVEVKVKEVIDDWILLTYDLPTTEEGNKMRAEFLRKASQIGAAQHTESVYLLPWCPESELLAVQLAEKGKLFVWIANVKDESKAKELTEKYDGDVATDFLEIRERLAKMKKHAEDGKAGVVERMKKKTDRMIVDAAGIAARRGSEKLAHEVERLKSEFEEIQVSSSGWVSELEGLL